MTLSSIIGFAAVASAVGLMIYLAYSNAKEQLKEEKEKFNEDEKDRRFDFIYRTLQRCFNYKQVINIEKLLDTHFLPSDKADSRYTNILNQIRKIKYELANRKTDFDIIEPCKN